MIFINLEFVAVFILLPDRLSFNWKIQYFDFDLLFQSNFQSNELKDEYLLHYLHANNHNYDYFVQLYSHVINKNLNLVVKD